MTGLLSHCSWFSQSLSVSIMTGVDNLLTVACFVGYCISSSVPVAGLSGHTQSVYWVTHIHPLLFGLPQASHASWVSKSLLMVSPMHCSGWPTHPQFGLLLHWKWQAKMQWFSLEKFHLQENCFQKSSRRIYQASCFWKQFVLLKR